MRIEDQACVAELQNRNIAGKRKEGEAEELGRASQTPTGGVPMSRVCCPWWWTIVVAVEAEVAASSRGRCGRRR